MRVGEGRIARRVRAQYPDVHSTHAVMPPVSWYLPASQLVHEPCPVDGCTVPGAHCEAERAPVEQNDPAGQSVQSEAAPSPVAAEYVPATHGSAALAPSAQYDPAGQVMHAVWPEVSMYLPAVHFGQVDCAVAGWMVPGLHSEGVSAPVEQKEPAGQSEHELLAVRPVELE